MPDGQVGSAQADSFAWTTPRSFGELWAEISALAADELKRSFIRGCATPTLRRSCVRHSGLAADELKVLG